MIKNIFSILLSLVLLACQHEKKQNPKNALNNVKKTKVMILGTPHLYAVKDYKDEMLDKVVEKLKAFDFDAVCIEQMDAMLMNDLISRKDTAFHVFRDFFKTRTKIAKQYQQKFNKTFWEAEHESYEMLKHNSNLDRKKLIDLFLISGDYYSAALQYNYLKQDLNSEKTNLIDSITTNLLEKKLSSNNEIVSLGIRLATLQNINKLEYIDDLQDEPLLLKYFSNFIEIYHKHEEQYPLPKNNRVNKFDKLLKEGTDKNDLSEIYSYVNSKEWTDSEYQESWFPFIKNTDSSKVLQSRYNLWEMRNLMIAAKISKVVAFYPEKTILVIIGASHKDFLEKYLKQISNIEVLKYE